MILKYNADEARNLKVYGELPESCKINETTMFGQEGEDDDIAFDMEEGDIDGDIDDVSDFKRGTANQKLSMLCAISQNY